MNFRHFILSTLAVLTLFTIIGFAQSGECGGFDKKVSYKILVDNITTKESRKHLYLDIYIKPDRFTVDSILRLAERIRNEYCEFDSIAVFFFDTKKREKIRGPAPQPLIDWVPKIAPRGMYRFERRANTTELEFQEKRNQKLINVEITLRPDGYCVSETPDEPGGMN